MEPGEIAPLGKTQFAQAVDACRQLGELLDEETRRGKVPTAGYAERKQRVLAALQPVIAWLQS